MPNIKVGSEFSRSGGLDENNLPNKNESEKKIIVPDGYSFPQQTVEKQAQFISDRFSPTRIDSRTDGREFDFNLIYGADNAEIRARRQSNWAKARNSVVQTIGSAAGFVVGSTGDALELGRWAATGFQSELQFNNLLTDFGKSIEEGSRNLAPIYNTNRSAEGGAGVLKFWEDWDSTVSYMTSNMPTIVSSLSIMLPTAAYSKGLFGLAKLTAKGLKKGIKKSSKLTDEFRGARTIAEQVSPKFMNFARKNAGETANWATNTMLSRHFYNTLEARDNYTQAEQEALQEGKTIEEARERANMASDLFYRTGWLNVVKDAVQWGILMGLPKIRPLSNRKITDPSFLNTIVGRQLKNLNRRYPNGIPKRTLQNLDVGIKGSKIFGKKMAIMGLSEGFEEINIQYQKNLARDTAKNMLAGENIEWNGFEENLVGYFSGLKDYAYDEDKSLLLSDEAFDSAFWAFGSGFATGTIFRLDALQALSNTFGSNAFSDLRAKQTQLRKIRSSLAEYQQAVENNDIFAKEQAESQLLFDLLYPQKDMLGGEGDVDGAIYQDAVSSMQEIVEASKEEREAAGLSSSDTAETFYAKALADAEMMLEIYKKRNKSYESNEYENRVTVKALSKFDYIESKLKESKERFEQERSKTSTGDIDFGENEGYANALSQKNAIENAIKTVRERVSDAQKSTNLSDKQKNEIISEYESNITELELQLDLTNDYIKSYEETNEITSDKKSEIEAIVGKNEEVLTLDSYIAEIDSQLGLIEKERTKILDPSERRKIFEDANKQSKKDEKNTRLARIKAIKSLEEVSAFEKEDLKPSERRELERIKKDLEAKEKMKGENPSETRELTNDEINDISQDNNVTISIGEDGAYEVEFSGNESLNAEGEIQTAINDINSLTNRTNTRKKGEKTDTTISPNTRPLTSEEQTNIKEAIANDKLEEVLQTFPEDIRNKAKVYADRLIEIYENRANQIDTKIEEIKTNLKKYKDAVDDIVNHNDASKFYRLENLTEDEKSNFNQLMVLVAEKTNKTIKYTDPTVEDAIKLYKQGFKELEFYNNKLEYNGYITPEQFEAIKEIVDKIKNILYDNPKTFQKASQTESNLDDLVSSFESKVRTPEPSSNNNDVSNIPNNSTSTYRGAKNQIFQAVYIDGSWYKLNSKGDAYKVPLKDDKKINELEKNWLKQNNETVESDNLESKPTEAEINKLKKKRRRQEELDNIKPDNKTSKDRKRIIAKSNLGNNTQTKEEVLRDAGYIEVDGIFIDPNSDIEILKSLDSRLWDVMKKEGILILSFAKEGTHHGMAGTITLKDNKYGEIQLTSKTEDSHTILHEIGHFVYNQLSQKEKNKYENYEEAVTAYVKNLEQGKLTSGASNAEENFVENWAFDVGKKSGIKTEGYNYNIVQKKYKKLFDEINAKHNVDLEGETNDTDNLEANNEIERINKERKEKLRKNGFEIREDYDSGLAGGKQRYVKNTTTGEIGFVAGSHTLEGSIDSVVRIFSETGKTLNITAHRFSFDWRNTDEKAPVFNPKLLEGNVTYPKEFTDDYKVDGKNPSTILKEINNKYDEKLKALKEKSKSNTQTSTESTVTTNVENDVQPTPPTKAEPSQIQPVNLNIGELEIAYIQYVYRSKGNKEERLQLMLKNGKLVKTSSVDIFGQHPDVQFELTSDPNFKEGSKVEFVLQDKPIGNQAIALVFNGNKIGLLSNTILTKQQKAKIVAKLKTGDRIFATVTKKGIANSRINNAFVDGQRVMRNPRTLVKRWRKKDNGETVLEEFPLVIATTTGSTIGDKPREIDVPNYEFLGPNEQSEMTNVAFTQTPTDKNDVHVDGRAFIIAMNPLGKYQALYLTTQKITKSAANKVLELIKNNKLDRAKEIVPMESFVDSVSYQQHGDIYYLQANNFNIRKAGQKPIDLTAIEYYSPELGQVVKITRDSKDPKAQWKLYKAKSEFYQDGESDKKFYKFEQTQTSMDSKAIESDLLSFLQTKRFNIKKEFLALTEYESPLNDKYYDSYIDYLTDPYLLSDGNSDQYLRENGASSILLTDIFNDNGSFFSNNMVKLQMDGVKSVTQTTKPVSPKTPPPSPPPSSNEGDSDSTETSTEQAPKRKKRRRKKIKGKADIELENAFNDNKELMDENNLTLEDVSLKYVDYIQNVVFVSPSKFVNKVLPKNLKC